MEIHVNQQKEATMRKNYIIPTINVVKIGVQPLMVLSDSNPNPQTEVNHEEYNEVFSSRRRRDDWDDDEEDW